MYISRQCSLCVCLILYTVFSVFFLFYLFLHITAFELLRESSKYEISETLYVSYFACDKWRSVLEYAYPFAFCCVLFIRHRHRHRHSDVCSVGCFSVYCFVWLHSSNTRDSPFRHVLAFRLESLFGRFRQILCVFFFLLICYVTCIRNTKARITHRACIPSFI